MTILMMTKILTNLSLYYAFVSLFRGNGSPVPVILSIFCCVLGIGAASKETTVLKTFEDEKSGNQKQTKMPKVWKAISFLILFLPFLVLRPFTHGQIGTGIMCLIPVIYCCILIFMGNLKVDYGRFETHLQVSAIVFLILLAGAALWNPSRQTTVMYTVLYLYSGTWLVRQLRLKEGSDTVVRIIDALVSAGFLLLVYCIGGLLLFLLGYAKNYIYLLLTPLEAILYLLAWLFFSIMSLFPIGPMEMPEDLFSMESMEESSVINETNEISHSGHTLRTILIMIAVVAVITIVIRLIHKYKNMEIQDVSDTKSVRHEKILRSSRNRNANRGTNSSTIRKLYQRYLKRLKADGMNISPNMTSEDIKSEGEKLHNKEVQVLNSEKSFGDSQVQNSPKLYEYGSDAVIREIYIKVRYNRDYVPEPSDQTEMKKRIHRDGSI